MPCVNIIAIVGSFIPAAIPFCIEAKGYLSRLSFIAASLLPKDASLKSDLSFCCLDAISESLLVKLSSKSFLS